MKKIACGEFVKRQTPESGFSHFNGSWEELEYMVSYWFLERPHLPYTKQGYRDGVIIQELPPDRFESAVVDLDEGSKLTANFAARREGEAPFVRVSAKSYKQKAKHASVVLYRRDVLAENNEAETDAEWEIVAIKARATEEEEPMHYYTMARNYLHLPGGTQGDFSANNFAKSIIYWHQHSMIAGKTSIKQRLANIWSAIFD